MQTPNYSQLIGTFREVLNGFDYALLTPHMDKQEITTIKVAIRSGDRRVFFQKLTESLTFQVIQSKLDTTILTIDLAPQKLLTLEIYHYFHSDRLTYLDIDEVLAGRKLSTRGYYIPKLEHLLEFSILNSFLNEEGLSYEVINQFKDLHILLQEGLLDYFNTKYDTYFGNLYELTDYKETIENHFRKQLKQFPVNKFANRMKLGWVNIKRFLKRSAVYSF